MSENVYYLHDARLSDIEDDGNRVMEHDIYNCFKSCMEDYVRKDNRNLIVVAIDFIAGIAANHRVIDVRNVLLTDEEWRLMTPIEFVTLHLAIEQELDGKNTIRKKIEKGEWSWFE